MDQLIFASLSHTYCWHEVGMLKVPAKGVHRNRQPPSDHSRVYQAMELRTDGFHRQESAGTEAAVSSSNGCCLFSTGS